MKLLFDTCVLYPTVMREMLMGTMEISGTRLLVRTDFGRMGARRTKNRPHRRSTGACEIALLRARWPKAEAIWPTSLEARLWLPDENDKHVLAAAIASSAD